MLPGNAPVSSDDGKTSEAVHIHLRGVVRGDDGSAYGRWSRHGRPLSAAESSQSANESQLLPGTVQGKSVTL